MYRLPCDSYWTPLHPRHRATFGDVLRWTWLLVTWLLVAPAFCSIALADGEWGDLKGRFVYGGAAPARKQLPIAKDQAAFGNTVTDESLLVNDDNKGWQTLSSIWSRHGELRFRSTRPMLTPRRRRSICTYGMAGTHRACCWFVRHKPSSNEVSTLSHTTPRCKRSPTLHQAVSFRLGNP